MFPMKKRPRRTETLRIRLTKAEKAQIVARAAIYLSSPSAWARMTLLLSGKEGR